MKQEVFTGAPSLSKYKACQKSPIFIEKKKAWPNSFQLKFLIMYLRNYNLTIVNQLRIMLLTKKGYLDKGYFNNFVVFNLNYVSNQENYYILKLNLFLAQIICEQISKRYLNYKFLFNLEKLRQDKKLIIVTQINQQINFLQQTSNKMSKQPSVARPSMSQNRQMSKVERLVKFIHANNITIKSQRNSDSNTNYLNQNSVQYQGENLTTTKNLNEQQRQKYKKAQLNKLDNRSNQLSKKIKQNYQNLILSQAINKFIEKQVGTTSTLRETHRGISLEHLRKQGSIEKQKDKTKGKVTHSLPRQQQLLPSIKTLKTQQTPGKDQKDKSELMTKIIYSKKYQSLLLLPKQISNRLNSNTIQMMSNFQQKCNWKQGDVQTHLKSTQRRLKRVESKRRTEDVSINRSKGSQQKNFNPYTRWQTNDQIKQFQFENLY